MDSKGIVCASICGAEKWDDIEAFARAKEAWLRRFFKLPHRIPSHDTIARVFSRSDPQALNERFVSWVCALNTKYEREVERDYRDSRPAEDARTLRVRGAIAASPVNACSPGGTPATWRRSCSPAICVCLRVPRDAAGISPA